MAGVSTATGCAANVLSNVVSCLWNKVVEEVKMVISLPQSITRMKTDAESLENQIHDINAELRRQPWSPKRIVKDWLDRAGKAIESKRSIDDKYQTYQQHRTCLGCCPNCLPRYRICKDIKKWELIVAQLQSDKQSKFPPSGEYGDPDSQIPIPNSESILVGKATRSEQMKLLVKWLTVQDSDIRRIGIVGMGGVGKTSLLEASEKSPEVRNSFELIIKVTVSRNNILDMQDCVADILHLREFPHRSNFEGRKDRLRSYLENKKFLLLLDDVWEDSALWARDDLEKLGVSLNDTGFKLVLTTRDEQVCTRMNVQQRIKVEVLPEDEGWELFRSRAFQNLNGDVPQELEEVARKIAKECKGLPLAIIVVAAAMAHHTDVHEWEVALAQMQKVDETFYDLHRGVDTKLFQRLRLSYDALGDDLKICFLYFAAYPEDGEIRCDELIDMWIAEGVVKVSGDNYWQDIGHMYMNHLRDRCLIQVVRTGVVKIHDILRDLAIMIAEKEKQCYFRAGQGGTHFPRVEDGWTRMSLVSTHQPSLPTTFTCSFLSVLLLSDNPDIKEVPGSFLRELPSLKVLDLSNTGITSLPPSIGNLKHLVFLKLYACKGICELPETIGDLKELQFLNVAECDQLRCLPERIGELKRLRSLDVRKCYSGKIREVPRGISELVSLERLEMGWGNISLDFEDDSNVERNYVCLKDLQSLSRLRRFNVKIKSPVKEGVMGNWSKMRELSLNFTNANQVCLPQDMQVMKDLKYLFLSHSNVERLPNWVSEFGKLASLGFSKCLQLKELPAELPCLTELFIGYSVNLMEVKLGMGFSKLETLRLLGLESLECVRVGTAASGNGGLGEGVSPLPMLKSLLVFRCEKLKTLRGEWDKLKCLEEIKGRREWWDEIQCDDPNIKTSLESKFRSIDYYIDVIDSVTIVKCDQIL